ncbi:GDSL esterase/lipase [Apostasia shenzhenica]|uniref:GDSL esterase/lipase n=1 Tax=Apostasia shenzhenica TaxID=1088818 RepID=A0A2H9ZTU0_9ASPA|nr:GDSL esterase/lipase [Apostasia shenzhenica]
MASSFISSTSTAVMISILLCFTAFSLQRAAAGRGAAAIGGSYGGVEGVPAAYLFGDSLGDVGNNNYLLTYMKADFAHNGIDFAGGRATGRFSNGKNSADFILKHHHYRKRLTFEEKHSQDECLSFNKQIDYFSTAYAAMVEQVGNDQAQHHLANSIFAIIIGSNDIFGYISSSNKPTPQQFVSSLITTLQDQLQRIYNVGARKFIFVGTGLVGCCPALRIKINSDDCDVVGNSVSDLYNQAVSSLLQKMKSQLSDMNYSFFNSNLAFVDILQRPSDYGFTEVKAACCGLGELNAKVACTPISAYCSNRKTYAFWDFYHPTEATAAILTDRIFNGAAPYVYPINAGQLASL